MYRRTVSGMLLVLLIISILTSSFYINPAYAYVGWDGWSINGTTVTEAWVDAEVTGQIIMSSEPTGHYKLEVFRQIDSWPSETIAGVTFDHNISDLTVKNLTFTASVATGDGGSKGYYMQLGKESWLPGIWDIVWMLGDSYPPRLKVFRPVSGTIYIMADGSIYPQAAPIQRSGNTYTLTGNIATSTDGIVIKRDNIVLNGAGHTMTGGGTGITLMSRSNVKVNNLVISNFAWGIYLHSSSGNIISANTLTDNSYPIYLSSSPGNTLSGNLIFHNNFVNNQIPQATTYNSPSIWDDGYPSGGNYWSDYSTRYPDATEIDNSGLWNTPYGIDANNKDNYPLMPTYSATINAYCNTEGTSIAVSITKDGSATGYSTPHTFSLSGSHTFTVPGADANGHLFLQWSTGQTSTTITVSSAGTYTAYYQANIVVNHTVNLDSRQDTHVTSHLGNITLDGAQYSLPSTVSKTSGTYSIRYNAPSGYEFDHWETIGGLNMTNVNAQSTSVVVSGNGNATAVYKKSIINYTIYLASKEENGTASNLGIIQFDNQSFTLPNNVAKPSAVYLICYVPASGNIFLRWEASSNVTVENTTSQRTTAMINGTGTVAAVFAKHAPELPSIGEVKAFYTLDSFFLGGMPDLVDENQYFVRGNSISMVEFSISLNGELQTFIDATPDSEGWFSSDSYDMSEVTSNMTITAYSLTGNSANLAVTTRVYEVPFWLASLIETAIDRGNITILMNRGQPITLFDNAWSISLSYQWPENPIDAIYNIPVPIIGGKYGITCGFGFAIGLQSNGKAIVGGGGGFQFYIADAEAKVGIYVTGIIRVQDGIKLESLAIRVSGSIQLPFSHKYSWGGVGIEVGIYVGGSVSFTLYLREASDGIGTFGYGLDWVGTEADIALWLGAYAQVGLWKGEARIEGEGKVTFTFHVPPPYFTYPDDLKVEARITLKLRFWWFSWKRDIFSYSSHSPVQWTLESSETGWIPREYANGNYSLYKWIANTTEGTYLENVYLYANPSVDSFSDSTIMVWTQDDLSKPYIQGYEIYYATWDEMTGTWSIPSAVTDDTNPQGDAVVKFDSNGNAVAVWTQVNNPVLNDTVNPFSLLKDVELAYAVWNRQSKTWSQPKQATNNRVFDYAPKFLSDESGNLMLVWMVDEDGNVSTYNDESIYSSIWNGSAWSAPMQVTNPRFITSPVSGAYNQGKAILVWSQDMDNNASTLSDIEVFQSEFNGIVWNLPTRMTNNTSEDANPSAAFWNNRPVFTWIERVENESDALMFIDPYGGNVSKVVLERANIFSPMLMINAQDELFVLWSNGTLPYSSSLYLDGNVVVSELLKREGTNETDIYSGIYDFGAGAVDVNFDGQINILDVALVAKAFNATPGNVTWNPDADLDGNKTVNIIDIARVAREFRKTFSDQIYCRRIAG